MLPKKQFKRTFRLLSSILVLTLTLSASMLASATEYTSQVLSTNSDELGINFSYYASLYVDDDTEKRAGTWLHATVIGSGRNVNMAAGQLGAQAVLYNENGIVRKDTGMQYNTTKTYFMDAGTDSSGGNIGYYSKGRVEYYTGTGGYSDASTTATSTMRSAIMAAPFAQILDVDGNYPTNMAGETYGSGLLEVIVGKEPDLIAAIGENDVFGYLRADDLHPKINTPEEAVAYMQALRNNRTLPLYDLNGMVVGSFVLDESQKSSVEAVSEDGVVLGNDDPIARLMPTLLNGEYPTNDNGESYGSLSLSSVVGHEPDLIAAWGTNDEIGYIRVEDWRGPIINTPEEAVEYMRSGANRRTVPLYDLEGNVIGEFTFS